MESNIIIFYKGVFNDEILNRIGNFIRQGFSGDTKAEKRLFALFIELAQNISYYSLERFIIGNQVGEFGNGEMFIKVIYPSFFCTIGETFGINHM